VPEVFLKERGDKAGHVLSLDEPPYGGACHLTIATRARSVNPCGIPDSTFHHHLLHRLQPASSIQVSPPAKLLKDIKIDPSGTILACLTPVDYYRNNGNILSQNNIKFFRMSSDMNHELTNEVSLPCVNNPRSFFSEFRSFSKNYYLMSPCSALFKISLKHNDINNSYQLEMDRLTHYPSMKIVSCEVGPDGCRYIGQLKGRVVKINEDGISALYQLPNDDSPVTHVTSLNKFDGFVAGCFSGRVYQYDLRSGAVINTISMPKFKNMNCPIVKLHPLNNGHQMVISAMKSQLMMWDRRFNSSLFSFKHYTNEHSYTSSILDGAESFFAAADDKQCVMMWSLIDGSVIRRVPARGPRPCICHTHSLGGVGGPPALLMSSNDGIIVHSLPC
jgi:hypothetical protein